MRPAVVTTLGHVSLRLATNGAFKASVRQKAERLVRGRPTVGSFASLARQEHNMHEHYYDDDEDQSSPVSANKHCSTCSCEQSHSHTHPPSTSSSVLPPPLPAHPPPLLSCQTPLHDPMEPLPKPNPEPKYSVMRRILPPTLTPLNSPSGRQYLIDALLQHTAASYLTLTEHSLNQSDPAYCGITSLLIVLNALAIDPQTRWKGGWRYYGSEDMLLASCRGCLDPRRIEREGITLQEFQQLATCQGLRVVMKQPAIITEDSAAGDSGGGGYSVDDFRTDVLELLSEPHATPSDENSNSQTHDNDTRRAHQQHSSQSPGILVTSFGRSALDQTGDGHFSPLAAYHVETDQVLVMDVARFKYQHYWVKVDTLYHAMQLLDKKTQQPRGWYKLYAPTPPNVGVAQHDSNQTTAATTTTASHFYRLQSEDRRTVDFVPLAGEGHPCPVHAVKVEYCPSRK